MVQVLERFDNARKANKSNFSTKLTPTGPKTIDKKKNLASKRLYQNSTTRFRDISLKTDSVLIDSLTDRESSKLHRVKKFVTHVEPMSFERFDEEVKLNEVVRNTLEKNIKNPAKLVIKYRNKLIDGGFIKEKDALKSFHKSYESTDKPKFVDLLVNNRWNSVRRQLQDTQRIMMRAKFKSHKTVKDYYNNPEISCVMENLFRECSTYSQFMKKEMQIEDMIAFHMECIDTGVFPQPFKDALSSISSSDVLHPQVGVDVNIKNMEGLQPGFLGSLFSGIKSEHTVNIPGLEKVGSFLESMGDMLKKLPSSNMFLILAIVLLITAATMKIKYLTVLASGLFAVAIMCNSTLTSLVKEFTDGFLTLVDKVENPSEGLRTEANDDKPMLSLDGSLLKKCLYAPLVALLGGSIFGTAFKSGKGINKLTYALSGIATLHRAKTGITWLAECAFDGIKMFCETVLGHWFEWDFAGNGDPFQHRVDEVVGMANHLQELVKQGRPLDFGMMSKLFLVDTMIRQITRELVGTIDPVHKTLASTLKTLSLDIKSLVDLAKRKNPMVGKQRIEPAWLHLLGGTAVGKSATTNMVSFEMLIRTCESQIEADFLSKYWQFAVYNRLASQEYWDRYWGQTICKFDELFYLNAGMPGAEMSIGDILLASNNQPFFPNQADLADKGTIPFTAQFCISTSNNTHLYETLQKMCVEPKAILRRFNLCVVQGIKEEFRKERLDTEEDNPLNDSIDMKKVHEYLDKNGKYKTVETGEFNPQGMSVHEREYEYNTDIYEFTEFKYTDKGVQLIGEPFEYNVLIKKCMKLVTEIQKKHRAMERMYSLKSDEVMEETFCYPGKVGRNSKVVYGERVYGSVNPIGTPPDVNSIEMIYMSEKQKSDLDTQTYGELNRTQNLRSYEAEERVKAQLSIDPIAKGTRNSLIRTAFQDNLNDELDQRRNLVFSDSVKLPAVYCDTARRVIDCAVALKSMEELEAASVLANKEIAKYNNLHDKLFDTIKVEGLDEFLGGRTEMMSTIMGYVNVKQRVQVLSNGGVGDESEIFPRNPKVTFEHLLNFTEEQFWSFYARNAKMLQERGITEYSPESLQLLYKICVAEDSLIRLNKPATGEFIDNYERAYCEAALKEVCAKVEDKTVKVKSWTRGQKTAIIVVTSILGVVTLGLSMWGLVTGLMGLATALSPNKEESNESGVYKHGKAASIANRNAKLRNLQQRIKDKAAAVPKDADKTGTLAQTECFVTHIDSPDAYCETLKVDLNTENIAASVWRDNSYYMFVPWLEESIGVVTFVKGTYMLMPNHFFAPLEGYYCDKGDFNLNFVAMGARQNWTCNYEKFAVREEDGTITNSVLMTTDECASSDKVIVFVNPLFVKAHKDIMKHFADQALSETLMGRMQVGVMLVTGTCKNDKENNHIILTHGNFAISSYRFETDKPESVTNPGYVDGGFRYITSNTRRGFCGGLVYCTDNSISQGKIIGMHVSGDGKHTAFAAILNREHIQACVDTLKDVIHESGLFGRPSTWVVASEDPISDKVSDIFHTESSFNGKKIVHHDLPLTNKYINSQHEFEESSLHPKNNVNAWSEVIGYPSLLTTKVISNVVRDPLRQNFNMGKKSPTFNLELLTDACSSWTYETNKRSNPIEASDRRVFTVQEAINGIPGQMHSIAKSSSVGAYWKDLIPGPKKKMKIFGNKGGEIDEGALFWKEFMKRHDADMAKMEKAERVFQYGEVCMKSERRTLEKYLEGKTRPFIITDLNNFVACRQYYGCYANWCQQNRIVNGLGIGLNPYSDWDELYKYLTNFWKGPGSIEYLFGDYSRWDESVFFTVLKLVAVNTDNWYTLGDSYEEKHSSVRICLIEDIASMRVKATVEEYEVLENDQGKTYIRYKSPRLRGLVLELNGGMPSGCFLTALFNSIVNNIVIRYVLMKMWISQISDRDYTTREHGELWSYLEERVRIITNGDDNGIGMAKELNIDPDLFTVEMSKIGFTYTSENKKDKLVKRDSLKDCSFLKREFKYSKELKKVVGPLSLDTITDTLYWRKKSCSDDDFTRNIELNLGELTYHGRDVFNTYYDKIRRSAQNMCNYPIKYGCDTDPWKRYLYYIDAQDDPLEHYIK